MSILPKLNYASSSVSTVIDNKEKPDIIYTDNLHRKEAFGLFEINMSLDTYFNIIYNAFYLPGTIIVLILNRLFAKQHRTNVLQRLFYTAVIIVFGFIGSHIGADVYNWFQVRRGRPANAIRTVFGTIFVDIIVITVLIFAEKGIRALLRKVTGREIADVDPFEIYDMLEPGAMVLIILTKFRCLWVGCCFGIPCSWGIYSEKIHTTVFPVQIVEAVMSFCIFLACYYVTQTKFFRHGMALFLGAGAFAFGRFFLEYLMYYEPEDRSYLGHLTFYQCLCILIFIVCLIIVIALYKIRPSDPLPGKLRARIERREQQTVTQKKKAKKKPVKKNKKH